MKGTKVCAFTAMYMCASVMGGMPMRVYGFLVGKEEVTVPGKGEFPIFSHYLSITVKKQIMCLLRDCARKKMREKMGMSSKVEDGGREGWNITSGNKGSG